MERAEVIVKVGAEGLVCAGVPGAGIGVAVKVDDGSPRALAPAVVHALRLLDAFPDDGSLEELARPSVLGGGRPVGQLLPVFEL
jgi:L-asparaginase II